MADLNDILLLSQKYLIAHDRQKERVDAWRKLGFAAVQKTLILVKKEILNQNPFFVSNLYVEQYADSMGLILKSGKIAVPLEANSSTENGFQIHFSVLPNGKINVFVIEHHLANYENPNTHLVEIVEDPGSLTEQRALDLVYVALNKVYKSSYLFLGE